MRVSASSTLTQTLCKHNGAVRSNGWPGCVSLLTPTLSHPPYFLSSSCNPHLPLAPSPLLQPCHPHCHSLSMSPSLSFSSSLTFNVTLTVTLTVTSLQESESSYVYQVSASSVDGSQFCSFLEVPQVRLRKVSDTFVFWKDEAQGKVLGLSFASERDTLRFLAGCTVREEGMREGMK